MLLRALAELKGTVAFKLDVVGNGPEALRWQGMVHALGLHESVHFHGKLALPHAVATMQNADVFCFTSLRDTSGNVVLEALAAGVPVVAFDHQGAADMVSAQSGILIPVSTPRAAVTAWAEAIRELAQDPGLLLRLSEGTTAQAQKFLWQSNGDRVNGLYRELAGLAPSRSLQRLPTAHHASTQRPAW